MLEVSSPKKHLEEEGSRSGAIRKDDMTSGAL